MALSTPTLLAAALLLATALAESPSTPDELAAQAENWTVVHVTVYVWVAIVALLFAYHSITRLLRHIRHIANLNHASASPAADGSQAYFRHPNDTWSSVKRLLLLAPLFRKRHNRELRLSAATNVGTIPSRVEFLFLLGYFLINIVTFAVGIDWNGSATAYKDARNRTGTLAVLNMIPLFLFAGRNNPLIWLLGISFSSYNLMHRWIGRIVVLETLAHVAFWMADKLALAGSQEGWAHIKAALSSQMIYCGLIGTVSLVLILLLTPSILRHAFYETFLHIHIVLAATILAVVWIHLHNLAQQTLLSVAIVAWVVERGLRMYSIIRRNLGNGVTNASLEALPGDAVRVTLRVARPWTFRPGQHIYLYIPALGLWTSHPFSVAWNQDSGPADDGDEKASLPFTQQDILPAKTAAASTSTSVSLIVRRRTGFTDRLYRAAESSPAGFYTATALVEGPYTSPHSSLHSYGTVMLFASGVGITHQVPHIRELVTSYSAHTTAARRVTLVWVIQSPEHLEWIRPWMTSILSLPDRRDVLKILLFVTRPRSTREIHSPSASVQMYPGKPDVGALMDKEQERQVGAMVVGVCGTGGLSDDVRDAVRGRCARSEVDFVDEAFSW